MADLRQELIDSGEEWSDAWENVLELHPQYLAAYLRLRKVPINDQYLPRKVQELVLLAMGKGIEGRLELTAVSHTKRTSKEHNEGRSLRSWSHGIPPGYINANMLPYQTPHVRIFLSQAFGPTPLQPCVLARE